MLSIFSLEQAEKWDEIVKSFKRYDVYYLSGYAKAFQLHGDGEPTLFFYEDENIKAINVSMKRDVEKDENFKNRIPEGSYFDMATPYGYGGFLIEGEATEQSLNRFDAEYKAYCKSLGIISEFVRFNPVLINSTGLHGIYDILRLGKTISINLLSLEQIWNDLTSKNRNMIRKAQKSGVEIFWGRSSELFEAFITLYKQTMDKDGAAGYYYFEDGFYNSILYDLKYNALLFYAVYQRKIIAMSIILFANNQMHYHLSASDREYQSFAPTNLLLYEAACWGCENGYKTLHLGGGLGSREDNLYRFKSAFNRNSNNVFEVGRKIFDEDKYEELVKKRKAECEIDTMTGFFPKYRF